MPYSERFEEALIYAARLHRYQHRKGSSIPYVTHLLAVAAIVGENAGTEEEVIAALLHDAVEDQGGPPTRAEIRARFGENVARIVDGCTDTDQMPKPPWRARKEAYIAHIRIAEPSVRLVSMADKLHNARSILADLKERGEAAWEKFSGGKDGSVWYYRTLADLYRAIDGRPLAFEFARVVDEIEFVAIGPEAPLRPDPPRGPRKRQS